MIVRAIKTDRIPIAPTNLLALVDRYIGELAEGTVLAITSKLVAICEGRFIRREAVPKATLIEREAEWFLPMARNAHGVVLTINHHRLIPNAGIDESNADGHYILWPADAQATANAVRLHLGRRFATRRLGVLITDSTTAPLRCGVTGIALAHSGFQAVNDYVGAPDLFGRRLRVTTVNVADALAAAAVYAMGEGAEQTPLAVISDLSSLVFCEREPSEAELAALRIEPADDLYAPLLQAVHWQPGRFPPGTSANAIELHAD